MKTLYEKICSFRNLEILNILNIQPIETMNNSWRNYLENCRIQNTQGTLEVGFLFLKKTIFSDMKIHKIIKTYCLIITP